MTPLHISIIIPCLNEAKTIVSCIRKANQALEEGAWSGEIIVADNGSTDGSIALSKEAGAKVISVAEPGYGAAIQGGVLASKGSFIIMADGDDSYNFLEIRPFIEKWQQGYHFVMGNRFLGGIMPDAMPFLHRYVGNPVLSFIGRLFFKNSFGDFHCGMRGFSRQAFDQMDLHTSGMEFASEMVVKASLLQIPSAEVPVTLYKDGRGGPSHLNTWSDGWRHLRFLLLFSPRWLFFYPGLACAFIGLVLSSLLLRSILPFQDLKLDVHTLLYTATLTLIGFQLIAFYILSQAFARREGISISSGLDLSVFKLEYGLMVAMGLLLGGLWLSISAIESWQQQAFGQLNPQIVLRKVIPAVTLILLSIQSATFSFFLSFLQIKSRKNPQIHV